MRRLLTVLALAVTLAACGVYLDRSRNLGGCFCPAGFVRIGACLCYAPVQVR